MRYRPASVPTVVVIALCAVACDSASTSTVTTGPTPTKCGLTLGQPSNIVAGGGTGTIGVTAQPECAWEVESQPSWITDVSPTSGQGNGSVSFQAAPNAAPSTREGDIVVNGVAARIRQDAASCGYTISPVSQTVPSSSGTARVAVSALNGCPWTATSNASWITIQSGTDGDGNGAVTLDIVANSGGAPRSGTVTIAGLTHTITQQDATQPPPPPTPPPTPTCTYSIAPTSESLSDAGGAGVAIAVTAASGCAWTAVSNAPWITITAGASGTGNGSVSYSAAANTGAARTGTMTIAGQTFTVNQAAPVTPTCTFTLSSSSASFTDTGGTGSVGITAPGGCAWTAVSNASWITITAGASGTGNGSVDYTVAANTGAARTGTLTIGGQTFTVDQSAVVPACTYTLSAPGITMPAGGGTGTVDVTAPAGCTWTASTSASWIAITSGATGSGNGTVAFTVSANSGASRTDTIVIEGQTFTVTQ